MCPDEDSLCGIRTIRRFSETLIQPYVRTYARTGNPDKDRVFFFVLLVNTGKIVLLVNY